MRYLHHGNVDIALGGSQVFSLLQRHAVFVFQIHLQPRHNAQHRHAGQVFYLLNTRVKQRNIATKFIDDDPFHPRPLAIVQKRQRAVDGGKDAASVNVRHEEHRALRHFGHPHVDDIAIAQVNLRRAARAFQHQHVILPGQAVIDVADLLPQARFVLVVADRVHIGRHLPHQHHLRFTVAGRF